MVCASTYWYLFQCISLVSYNFLSTGLLYPWLDLFLNILFYFFKDFIYLFLERGREGEREGEKHQCVVASHVPPTEVMAHNPGMCPRLGIELVTLWFTGQHSIH